jgi:hypothetical protein
MPTRCTISTRFRSPRERRIHSRNARRRTAGGACRRTLTLKDGGLVSLLSTALAEARPLARAPIRF